MVPARIALRQRKPPSRQPLICYAPAPNRDIKRRFCLTSVCLSVAYIWPKSITERPRKTKIGTEVAHVTRNSDTTFKVKTSKVKVTRPLCSPPRWPIRQLQRWTWLGVGREKLLLRCRLLGRASRFGANGGRTGAYRGGRPPYSLFNLRSASCVFRTVAEPTMNPYYTAMVKFLLEIPDPDPEPDWHQNLIDWSVDYVQQLRKIW